jgi:hypothetical protein
VLAGDAPEKGCLNEDVCIRCAEEGHNSGGCKSPRSPESEEELCRVALAMVARRRGMAGVGRSAAMGPQDLVSPTPILQIIVRQT